MHTASIRRTVSLTLTNLGASFVLAGGAADLVVTTMPRAWLDLLGSSASAVAGPIQQLSLGLLHALGGALVGIGLASLVLINGPLRRGARWPAPTIGAIILVSDGTNAVVMSHLGISYFWVPLAFVVLVLTGLLIGFVPDSAYRTRPTATARTPPAMPPN